MSKRNNESLRAARHMRNGDNFGTDNDGNGKSKYSRKVREGNQMYGAGTGPNSCCAHRIRLPGDRS